MLHEVTPNDITDELLTCLTGYLRAGDVDLVGIATSNALTEACVGRAPHMFAAVHFAAGPFAPPIALPDSVTVRVGHGLLGAGASDLRRLNDLVNSDAQLADQWRRATGEPHRETADGLAAALLGRAATLGLSDVIVATSRPATLAKTTELVSGRTQVEPAVLATLEQMVRIAESTGAHPDVRRAAAKFNA